MAGSSMKSQTTRPARPVDLNDLAKVEIGFYLEIWRQVRECLDRFRRSRSRQFLPATTAMQTDSPEIIQQSAEITSDMILITDELYALMGARLAAGNTVLLREDDAYELADKLGEGDRTVRRFFEDLLLVDVRELTSSLTATGLSQRDGFWRIVTAINEVCSERGSRPSNLAQDLELARALTAKTDTPDGLRRRFEASQSHTMDSTIRLFVMPGLRDQGLVGDQLDAAVAEIRSNPKFAATLAQRRDAYTRALEEDIAAIWPQA